MPTSRDLANAGALLAAVVLSALLGVLAWPAAGARAPAGTPAEPGAGAGALTAPALVSGTDGIAIPAAPYQRIVSLDPASDDALVALGMVPRLVAVSDWSRAHAASRRLLASVAGHAPVGVGVEALIRLTPDLVLIGPSSDAARTAQARAAGLVLFAASGDGTAQDAADTARRLGRLLGAPEQGEAVASAFLRRLRHAGDPRLQRLGACYCSCFGGRIFGGTSGTSFHDLLEAAGFTDLPASGHWHGWPEYHLEDLVAMAPSVIITPQGGAALLAGLPGGDRVPAIRLHRIIELDPDLLQRTGLGLLETAEALADARATLP